MIVQSKFAEGGLIGNLMVGQFLSESCDELWFSRLRACALYWENRLSCLS